MIEFGIFAFVTSITPGPNNSMLMASGIRFGRKKSLPHFFGIWLGFNFLFFLGGNSLSYVPDIVFQYLQYAGYVVILYIAYKVAMTKTSVQKNDDDEDKPFTFLQAALFQWVNPKGVVMAVSGLTAFQLPHLQANLIYLIVGGPCVLTWLYLGESLQNFLIGNQKLERVVYVLLALSMVASLLLA
jgi:threonine/homoserine/homoserine lactone efflux protein